MLLCVGDGVFEVLGLLPAVERPFWLVAVALDERLLRLLDALVVGHVALLVVLVDLASQLVEFLAEHVGVLALRSARVLGLACQVLLLDRLLDLGTHIRLLLAQPLQLRLDLGLDRRVERHLARRIRPLHLVERRLVELIQQRSSKLCAATNKATWISVHARKCCWGEDDAVTYLEMMRLLVFRCWCC